MVKSDCRRKDLILWAEESDKEGFFLRTFSWKPSTKKCRKIGQFSSTDHLALVFVSSTIRFLKCKYPVHYTTISNDSSLEISLHLVFVFYFPNQVTQCCNKCSLLLSIYTWRGQSTKTSGWPGGRSDLSSKSRICNQIRFPSPSVYNGLIRETAPNVIQPTNKCPRKDTTVEKPGHPVQLPSKNTRA